MTRRRPLTVLAIACLAIGLTATAGAQPVNDACTGAITLTCPAITTGTTVGAGGENLGNCGTSDGSGGGVWYHFVGTGDEIEVTTCNSGSDYDTKLRVYSGTCASLNCITGNDDDNTCTLNSLRSRVSWVSTLGVDYYILVHGYSGSEGNFEVSLICLAPPAPDPNDDCINATIVTPGTYLGDTAGNNSDGSASCGATAASVWYQITATEQTLRASTCGSTYNTMVSIHTACPGTTANEIACNDNSCGQQSVATATVTIGSTYWVRVSGNGASGNFTLLLENFDGSLVVGPDVVYSDCTGITKYGPVGSIYAYSLGSNTCNIGDENLQWGSVTPLLAMNAYRLRDGRMEQLGMSFVKNGTGAAAGGGCGLPCNGQGGSVLGAGCLDVYGSGFNGIHSILGPRSTVNAFTGAYPGASGPSGTAIDKRLQIEQADLVTSNSIYFVEGVYVAPDDAANNNAWNNASYKRVLVTGSLDLNPTGPMAIGSPAIYAWQDHGLGVGVPDPAVQIDIVDVPSEGRFFVGHKATDLGSGNWRYDYAVFNLNSDRSSGSFSIPVPAGATVVNTGFKDVPYHSLEPYDGTDWAATVNGGSITWSSPQTFAQNPDSNALRWGTMYNFWFECDCAPATATATLGLFRPGTPSDVTTTVTAPGGSSSSDFVRADCAGGGTLNLVDATSLLAYIFNGGAAPGCLDACDGNDDGDIDISDPVAILSALFLGVTPPGPYPICGQDTVADGLDCATFPDCP
ncbi:MAG: hypothetical protein AAF581_06275 [Planctomycetota bacterium]